MKEHKMKQKWSNKQYLGRSLFPLQRSSIDYSKRAAFDRTACRSKRIQTNDPEPPAWDNRRKIGEYRKTAWWNGRQAQCYLQRLEHDEEQALGAEHWRRAWQQPRRRTRRRRRGPAAAAFPMEAPLPSSARFPLAWLLPRELPPSFNKRSGQFSLEIPFVSIFTNHSLVYIMILLW